MKGILSFVVFTISCMLLTTCGNDDLKEPVALQFEFSFEPSNNESLSFGEAELLMSSFTFDGMRQAGDDIYFKIDYPQGLDIDIFNAEIPDELLFDIPQGIYDDIEIIFKLRKINERPSFYTEGTILIEEDDDEEEYDFLYREKAPFTISLHAVSENGSSQIILDKTMSHEAEVSLDPNILFGTITSSDWEDAEEDDDDILITNDSENNDLYTEVSQQMPNAFSFVIF